MKSAKGSRWTAAILSAGLLLTAPMAAHSDPPTFSTTLTQGTDCQVWDITGTINYVEDVPGLGRAVVSFTVATNKRGKVNGTGTLDATITAFPGLGTVTARMRDPQIKAKVKASDSGRARFKLESKMKGNISIAGRSIATTSNLKVKGDIDRAGEFQGSGSFRVKARGVRPVETRGPITFDLTPNPANNGTWNLNMAVDSANGKTLRGSADVVLATGRVIDDLNVKGKYNSKKDSSKMNAKNEPTKIQFKNLKADSTTNTFTGGSMKYTILGQKNSAKVDKCS